MDSYTKFILTIIAMALSLIAFPNMGAIPAVAQNDAPAHVTICNANGSKCGFGADQNILIHGPVY